jgi:hypothetical protein
VLHHLQRIFFALNQWRHELILKWTEHSPFYFVFLFECLVEGISFTHPPMLGGLHAVVVLSVYAIAEGVAPLESAGGLEDLELDHNLHPLKLVVFLEELQIC